MRGPGAADFVNACLTNDLGRIHPGKAQYTLCCNDDGGVIDDIIAYLRSDDEVFLIPNAANNTEVVRLPAAAAPEGSKWSTSTTTPCWPSREPTAMRFWRARPAGRS